MSNLNKIHLTVKRDKLTQYFYHGKGKYRLQLCWDSRQWKPWFWIKQLALELGKENFMKDFADILSLAEERQIALFSLYELPEIINMDIQD